ncbi:MAG: methyltransferase [Candidatus Latescibacteria bacterium]|nr:methyltransferase [Candidatus Latescibacterota bacterium]NIM21978.1 methyltransferase [Candidatus Latescibacterota bacterium]NIM65996.1 methyltransferase [Candidatus Latescibacterota bacterium]NIO02404.1 methyltransferase [Candidatus Latescibacterota bacterium]NIO29314.1 methyltransferase [Candidatus Latescibacterota bacterium]
MNFIPKKIEDYCADNTSPESPLLKKLAEETHATMSNPQMLIGRVEGVFLKLLVKITSARRILEIGSFTGYSALMMAEALPEDGRLITCDIDPRATGIARRYWDSSPHGRKIELKLGPALQTIEEIEGPFDLVFIDADKENYIRYWDECMPKIRSGGVIIADNVLWSGRVLAPKEKSDRALAAFNNHVRNDRRVDAVMLAIRDGITLACKR